MTPANIRDALADAQPVGVPWDADGITYVFGNVEYVVTPDPHNGRTYTAGWPWEQRHGKPWQEAMERHVEEFVCERHLGAGI